MTVADTARYFLDQYNDPAAIARYEDGPYRFVPGLDALHRMVGILVAERAPASARLLVLGAGGGLELRALADAQPGWSFAGVDPARAMLDQAARRTEEHRDRIELIEGYIDDAPEGPFDAAICLLTLHFLGPVERERTLREMRRRLRPGAPLVVAHGSFPQGSEVRDTWLSRYAAYAVASGADPDHIDKATQAVAANVAMLDPADDVAVMEAAGFTDVDLFYAAFTWRGWFATA